MPLPQTGAATSCRRLSDDDMVSPASCRSASGFPCSASGGLPQVRRHMVFPCPDHDLATANPMERCCAVSGSHAPPRRHFLPRFTKALESRFAIVLVETMGLTETAAQILANPLTPESARPARRALPSAPRWPSSMVPGTCGDPARPAKSPSRVPMSCWAITMMGKRPATPLPESASATHELKRSHPP